MTSHQTMRYLLCFFLFSLFTNCKEKKSEFIKTDIIPTLIDSLNTKEQVENYIRKLRYPIIESFEYKKADLTHNFLEKFELKKINEFDRDSRFDLDSITKILADSLGISKSFYKYDIDNNGFTDLFVIGDDKGCQGGNLKPNSSRSCDFSVYSFMNFGNDSIRPIDLIVRELHNSIVPNISIKYGAPILEIYKPAEYNWIEKRKITENKVIDLTYKFGSFIEHNSNPDNYNIEKIEFRTEISGGYRHPHFEILIEKNKSSVLKAIDGNSIYENTEKYNDTINEVKGEFKSIIKEKDFNEIVNLLNYMDFPNMEDRYSLRRMHTNDCVLKITYSNGKIKEINDYGMFGTYGLNRLYELLFDLRFNQEWK